MFITFTLISRYMILQFIGRINAKKIKNKIKANCRGHNEMPFQNSKRPGRSPKGRIWMKRTKIETLQCLKGTWNRSQGTIHQWMGEFVILGIQSILKHEFKLNFTRELLFWETRSCLACIWKWLMLSQGFLPRHYHHQSLTSVKLMPFLKKCCTNEIEFKLW